MSALGTRQSLPERMALGYAAAAAFALDSWAETSLAAERTQNAEQARLMLANAKMWDAEHARAEYLARLVGDCGHAC